MMRKLLKKLGKRSRESSSTAETQGTSTATPRSERFGLFLLAESAPNTNENEHYAVDIIAVHGLNGDAYTTWTHANGTLWIRDLLPKFLPGCRVYTYGYPSQVAFSTSFAEVQEYSRRLLSSIRDVQEDCDQAMRSIIFVCHSLGGIVCKQALVLAHEDDMVYGTLLNSVAGVVFMGTPHKGNSMANLGSVVGRIVNTCLATTTATLQNKAIRTDLLDYLNYDSRVLHDLAISVRNRLQDLMVISFYETEALSPLSSMIVDKASSVLGIPREEVIPLYANHRDICRFPGETDDYKTVSKAVRRIARNPRVMQHTSHRASTHSSETLNESEKSCMKLLSVSDIADYQRMLPKPAKGTCQWIVNHPDFVAWADKAESALLWLTGHPGCGKTILSFFLAKHLEEARPSRLPNNVCVYFCDDKVNKQRDAKDILLGVIFQVICRHRSLIRHVRRVFDIQGPNMIQSFAALWDIFVKITTDPKSGPTYIIIDGLDECESTTRHSLLDCIRSFTQAPSRMPVSGQHVKFVVTSRPSLMALEGSIDDVAKHRIAINEGQRGYEEDLQIFIQQRVDEISQRRNISQETREFLRQTLHSKSGQTFLWVHMVLTSLEKSVLASVKDFQHLIATLPPDLETTYLGFLSGIPADHQDKASKLLKLILGSSRPLTLDEINIAFTIDSSHRTSEIVASNCQSAMQITLQGILGPLVRISDSKVALVHQSAKDFLLHWIGADHESPAIIPIREEDCALLIASACIYYLLLEDFAVDVSIPEKSHSESASDSPGPCESSVASTDAKPFWDDDAEDLFPHNMFTEPDTLVADACQLLASKHAFYRYASLHWAEHFALCEASAPVGLREAARSLLDINTTSCSNWLLFFRTEMAAFDHSVPESFDLMTAAAYFNLHETLKHHISTHDIILETQKDHALFWAAEQGHCRIVKTLLRAGADPNAQVCGRQSALICASQNGHLDCVVTLSEDKRTDLNLRGKSGRTALMFACSSGHYDIVKTLLGRDGCKVDEEDDSGATALSWAAVGGHARIISELTTCPTIDLNHRDKRGRTAVSWAAGEGMDQVLKTLLKVPEVDANLDDGTGRSPLSWAAGNGCAATVRVLVRDTKVDKASVDRDQRNAISWACAGGHLDALRVLIRHGCPGVDDRDVDGWTPLAWAVQHDSPHIVETLVSNKSVNLERRDDSGRTPLAWAVGYGHLKVVKALLRGGADPESTSVTGQTPVSIAREFRDFGRDGILEELLFYIKERKEKGIVR